MKKTRRRKKKEKNIIIICVFAFIICISIIGIIISQTHNYFNIKNVNVTGNKKIDTNKVIEESNSLGKNIFRINKEKIKKNLEKEEILNIEVNKKYPNELDIKILENYNIGYVEDNGEIVYIDTIGNVHQENYTEIEEIPAIKGIDIKLLKKSENIFKDEKIKEIINEVQKNNINLIEYDFSNKDNIKLKTTNLDVTFGEPDKISDKIEVLKTTLASIGTNDTKKYDIDVRNLDKPLLIEK